MAVTPYFSTITSASVFHNRFKIEEAKPFSELYEVSASNWGREYLFACRVIRRTTQRSVLPFLSQHVLPSDLHSSSEIKKFLEGPDASQIGQSEHGLVRDPSCGISLGQIWASMAMLQGVRDQPPGRDIPDGSGDEEDSDSEARAKRPRRHTLLGDYIDSSTIQIGSSSPVADGSHSEGTSSVGYVDPASHMTQVPPEDETLRLASCTIRHILHFAPPQDSTNLEDVVEFRDAKIRLSAHTVNIKRKIAATDDGGLCLRSRDVSNGIFKTSQNRVAIVEAKRQFQCLENGRPVISDDCFAQMTCEALVARLADSSDEPYHGNVILIHCTRQFMCFLHFEVSDSYLNTFDSAAPASFLYVNSTPWFDIGSKSGREQVVLNICGIMRWTRSV